MYKLLFILLLFNASCQKNIKSPVKLPKKHLKVPIMTSTNYYEFVQARFPGCEDEPNENKRQRCAQTKLKQFITENLQYPRTGACVEGTNVVQVTITKRGKLKNLKLVRDIGGGTGQEALRLVKMMPRWIPAYHKASGRKIEAQYNLPIRFKLD
jgi:hypothetical protein